MKRLLLLLITVAGCSAQAVYSSVEGRGPLMVKEPLDKIFNVDSNIQSLYLDCEASADPRPDYTWQRDGAPLDVESNSRYQLSRGRLTIVEPDQDDDPGTYQCFPSNQIGTIMSRKAKLEFAFVGFFSETSPPDVEIPVNTGMCISCDPPDHFPGLNVFWYNGPLPILESARTHTDKDGRLCFANFLASDAGNYKCFVLNSIDTGGGASTAKFSDTFAVTAGPEAADPEHGPTVAVEVEDQEVLLGQEETTLSCFFFGNPVPSIQWRRISPAGAELPALYELKSNNQKLVLKNIQLDDAGEYECYTEEGNVRSSGMVSVRVPPTWVQELTNAEGNIHESMSWSCEADSPDGVSYKWYRNAQEIVDLPRHQLSNGLKTLTITNLTVEDTGMYQCVAYNDYGEIYTTGQLTVLAIKPQFITPLEQNQPAPRGGTVTILCRPVAAPTPTFQWTKGGQVITSDGHYTILENGDLQIVDVSDADAGDYTCTATNSLGAGSSTGTLVVKDGTAIVEPPTDQIINQGEDGVLTCRASHDPYFELDYAWMKDGTQVDLTLPNYEQPEVGEGEASTLHIIDAQMDLGGVYTCMAITTIDEASAEATVTVRGRPGAPAGISVVVNGLAANVSWSHGADNNSPIQSYIIEGSTNHVPEWTAIKSDVPAASTHTRLTGLSAWSTYKFRVVAVNEVGRGEPSDESDEQETAQSRPTEAPTNVGGGEGSEGDLKITWTPLPRQEWNAPDLSYIVFWREQDSEAEFEEYLVEDAEAGVYVAAVEMPYTPYEVQIQVQNSEGPGPKTDPVIVYSFQRRPEEAPTSVAAKAVSASEVQVSWTGIDAGAIVGELKGYKIKYWSEDTTEELGVIVTVPVPDTEGMIQMLEPDTMYNLKVMAYSGGGSGPESSATTVRTRKSAPQQAPGGVTVSLKGTTSMTVKWNPLAASADEEPLQGYKVLYWPQGSFEIDAEVEKVGKTTNQITIDNLEQSTTYYVKVKGYNAGGDGVASEPPASIETGKTGQKLPRSSASTIAQSVLLVLLPFLVAFHLR